MRNAALSLLSLFVCLSAVAAGRDITTPVLGPFPVAANLPPVVATNGETFLTLWLWGPGVYGSLADADGQRISPSPFRVLTASVTAFQLVAIERDYVLFWTDASGAHLTELGPDAKPIRTVSVSGVESLIGVAAGSNGSDLLIAGATGIFFPPARVVGYVLRRDGPIVGDRINVAGYARVQVSRSGDDFLVTTAETTGVFLQRVAANGSIRPPGKLQVFLAGGPYGSLRNFAASASSGNEVVAVWSDWVDATHVTLSSAAVTNDGQIISRRQIATLGIDDIEVGVVWTGDVYVATAGRFAMRLDRSGAPLDPRLVSVGERVQSIASIRDMVYGVAAKPSTISGAFTAIGTRFRTSGGIHDARSETLSIAPRAQWNSSVASDGVDFMSAFAEETATTSWIAAARINRGGSPLDGGGLQVVETTPSLLRPAIAFGGSTYLVAWTGAHGLEARRFSMDGVALDPAPIAVRTKGTSRPAVAWSGSAFLVVWLEDGHIFDATIAPDGMVSTPRLIALVSYYVDEPDVAWNGQTFLVIFALFTPCPFECVIRTGTAAVRVAADGTPIDPPPVIPTFIDTTALGARTDTQHSSVASNGRDFLVALDGTFDLSVVPVTTTGGAVTVGLRKTLFRSFGGIQSDIGWNGSDYVVAWRYPAPSNPAFRPNQWWLAAARLNSIGERYATVFTSIASATYYLAQPSTASNQLGDTIVTTSEQQSVSDPGRVRAYFDWEMSPMPAPPLAPRNVVVTGSRENFVVSWEPTSSDAAGFIIERFVNGNASYSQVVEGNQDRVSISAWPTDAVRVRAYNAGGMSEPSELVPVQPGTRRRAMGSR